MTGGLTTQIAEQAITYYQARQLQKSTKKALLDHHIGEDDCLRGGVPSAALDGMIDLPFNPQCFRTQRPREEWCSWCREHYRIWQERRQAARAVTASLNRLNRLCKKAIEQGGMSV